MRLFILLCSDLGIRSGTAVSIAPQHYDQAENTIRFTTKKAARVALPVTDQLKAIFDTCDLTNPLPFLTQVRFKTRARSARQLENSEISATRMRKEFKALKDSLGIERKFIPHDLRRSSAVKLYKLTHDLRAVQAFLGHSSLQSTIWYLDHDLEEVELANLEAIKKPFIAWRKETRAA